MGSRVSVRAFRLGLIGATILVGCGGGGPVEADDDCQEAQALVQRELGLAREKLAEASGLEADIAEAKENAEPLGEGEYIDPEVERLVLQQGAVRRAAESHRELAVSTVRVEPDCFSVETRAVVDRLTDGS